MPKKKNKIKKKVRKTVRRKSRRAKPVKKVQTVSKRGDRFVLNTDFEFLDELRTLILKSSPAEKDIMIRRISGLGRVKLAVISGVFLNQNPGEDSTTSSAADLVIIGDDINRKKLKTFLAALEAEVGADIKFTLMEKEEFIYRHGMFDRFVRVLLEGPHEKIINKLGI